jgi:hypothetical protein
MSQTVEPIIPRVDRELIKQELSNERFARKTRKGDNEIYIINHHNSPNTVREIGRLREVTFRAAGGGTKLSIDLDDYDTTEVCYEQLIVWSPEDEEIIGGYRFIDCAKAIQSGQSPLPMSTTHYFNFTERFVQDYLPYTIELGRSWVQPMFQPSVDPRKGLFALDNIWDGLGVLTVLYPNLKYFFGKVTMYPEYNRECRNILLYFMHRYFPDTEKLVTPIHPLVNEGNFKHYEEILNGLDFKEGFKALNQYIRANGENIPPLVNIYMNLSPTMKTFGTAVNPDFGGVEETGIMVTIADIYEEKKERHIAPLLNT